MLRRAMPVLFSLLAASALSAAPRVFVASTGVDTNACTRQAPCRTFAQAITQVSPAGEIVALDTAGYGAVLIPFSVSIYSAPGAVAAVAGTVDINAAPGDSIDLRDMFVVNPGFAAYGVVVHEAGSVHVEQVTFSHLDAALAAACCFGNNLQVVVAHSRFLDSASGIVCGDGAQRTIIVVTDSEFAGCAVGVSVTANAPVVVTDSLFLSSGTAISANRAHVTAERCTFRDNGTALAASGSGGTIRVAHSILASNTAAFATTDGGTILTRLDGTRYTNTVEDNTSVNLFTATYDAH